jgi:hypothetical protein
MDSIVTMCARKCSFALRLKAKLSGWKTPMMICSEKKVVGMENIKQALKEIEKEGRADA